MPPCARLKLGLIYLFGGRGFFSWPSRGTLRGYLADEATVQISEGAVAKFLVEFAEKAVTKLYTLLRTVWGIVPCLKR
jgi:hypothetical protein